MATRASSFWFFAKGANSTSADAFTPTTYYLTAVQGHMGPSTTESAVQAPFRTAGILSFLHIRLTANSLGSGTTTVKTRVGGADGNQTISITAGTTGDFQDVTHSDSIAGTGDLVDVQLVVPTGAGSITFTIGGLLFTPTALTDTLMRFEALGANTTVTGGGDQFQALDGLGSTQTTEASEQFKLKTAGTLKNLFVNINTNGLDKFATVRSRKNAANGNMAITIAAGTTGIFEDTSNTDTVAVDDLVNYRTTPSASAVGSLTYGNIGCSLVTTNGKYHLISATNNGISQSAGATLYMAIGGTLSLNNATEDTVKTKASTAAIYSNLQVRVITNTIAATSTIRTRKNSANGGQSITVASATTGYFEDTSGTDTVAASDYVDYQMVTGGSSGSYRYNVVGVLVSPTTLTQSTSDSGAGADASSVTRVTLITASDTGTGTDTGGKVRQARVETATGADVAHPSASMVRTDSGTGVDVSGSTVPRSASDTGTGSEASHPSASQIRPETATGADVAHPSASMARSDSGTGADTARIGLAFADPSNLSPIRRTLRSFVPNLGAQHSVLFARAGWPWRPAIPQSANINGSDTGAGVDTGGKVKQVRAETATGTEGKSLGASMQRSETGTGVETSKVIQRRTETATGVETSTPSASLHRSDASAFAADNALVDKGTAIERDGADTGSAIETSHVTAAQATSDGGSGVEGRQVTARAAGADQATGTEAASTSSSRTRPDTATGADAASVSAITARSDSGSGVEGAARIRQPRTDQGASSETASTAATSRLSEAGAGAEGAVIAQRRAEAAAAVEAAIVIIRSADSATGSDASSSISVVFNRTDEGLGVDLVSRREFAMADSGVGTEGRAVIPLIKHPLTTVPYKSSLTMTTPVHGSITSTEKVSG